MTEDTETPKSSDVAGRLDGLVGRLRSAALNKALPIGEAWNLLDEAADTIEYIENMLDYQTECPCCLEHHKCEDGCTFVTDDPEGYASMMYMRDVLTPNVK